MKLLDGAEQAPLVFRGGHILQIKPTSMSHLFAPSEGSREESERVRVRSFISNARRISIPRLNLRVSKTGDAGCHDERALKNKVDRVTSNQKKAELRYREVRMLFETLDPAVPEASYPCIFHL